MQTVRPLFTFLNSLAQLIRLPNLLIIILTQLLLRYCILLPYLYENSTDSISPLPDFSLLILVTVLMAVGGYVINDYFDVKIDRINRPGKVVINRVISGHTAIMIHMILNGLAILAGFYLAWRIHAVTFGFIFPFISGLLWIYSAKYKRVLFWGNFIVAGLSGFVILLVWLFEFFWLRMNAVRFAEVLPDIDFITSVFLAYATFAFLLSLVREIIKDMEDTEGDQAAGCRTVPLVLGIQPTKYIVGAILLASILLLVYVQVILFRLSMYMAFWYFIVTVQAGSWYLFFKLFLAREKQDYHFLSSLCKLIMVAGILSMEIILISN